jgi:hypothetical protein
MVSMSKASIKEQKSNKTYKLVGRSILIAVCFVLFVRLMRKIENKEIHFRLRRGDKEYIAKVKVGNVTQQANELYNALFNTDREEVFENLFENQGNAAGSEEISKPATETQGEAKAEGEAESKAEEGVVSGEKPEAQAVPAGMPEGMPEKCEPDQQQKLQKQLTSDNCFNPQNQWCSYSKATKCHDPGVFKTYHSYNHVPTEFTAVFIGCNNGIDAVTTLRLGAWDNQYSPTAWFSKLQEGLSDQAQKTFANCFGEVEVTSNKKNDGKVRPAQVYCFEPPSSIVDELKRTATELKWDDKLHVDSNTMATVSLDDYVENNPLGKAPWIHFLSIGSFGYDFTILQRAEKTLKKVHYLEFELTWKGDWAKQTFHDAIDWLMNRDFVCYWPGQENKMWRITGCWQDMYKLKSWSHVACVNTKYPDKILQTSMETVFLQTLEQNVQF